MWDNARADWGSHHLRIQQRHGVGSGKLHVSIQRDWIDRVWPRAFTLVSKVGWSRPVWQTMRIAPVEGDLPQVRYRIVSDQPWLEAVPPEWTSAEGEVEIAVTANGAALAAEAYAGKLEILTVRDGDPPTGGTPTGIEIPVHFVVMPDDHGDMRGAATEIAAGAAVQGRLEVHGDEDWFQFRTTAASTRVTAYTDSEGDTVGELHLAGGSVVTDDDTGSGRNFRITATVPAGTHLLRVSGLGTPDYALVLEKEAGFPMEFVRIPAGSFVMGSPEDEDGRFRPEQQHLVRISQDFWMGKYEVTQFEWHAVMGANPSRYKRCGPRCPVETVSWHDIQEFIRRLNERESGSGYAYRLPTEAEWEYAARAGTTGARYGELDEVAWYRQNSGGTTHPVGQKGANAWGLHDMLGNVAEWTADYRGWYPSGAVTDPQGPDWGGSRVVRGGYYGSNARFVRSASRSGYSPESNPSDIGFRVVRTARGDDHGDTSDAATEIAAGAAAQGRLEVLGDEDWFEFRTTAANTRVTAYTVSEGDTVGELHTAGGAVVTDDDSGSGGNFRIAANVPAGRHFLRVHGRGTADYTLELEAGFPMEFVRIPAGSFVMGSPEDEEGRRNEPQHEVRISRGFWIGKYEVTQGEWEAVMGANPSYFQECGSRCPVETVSWDDIKEFIRRLNERESGSGYAYRLPTEAEWEYAARAGTTGARYGELDEVAWYRQNSGGTTHPVGQKGANVWGLHDMLGNVREWTADWYGRYPSGAVTDPQGPDTGSSRVVRGGGWYGLARSVRSANRSNFSPGRRYSVLGCRLVRTE